MIIRKRGSRKPLNLVDHWWNVGVYRKLCTTKRNMPQLDHMIFVGPFLDWQCIQTHLSVQAAMWGNMSISSHLPGPFPKFPKQLGLRECPEAFCDMEWRGWHARHWVGYNTTISNKKEFVQLRMGKNWAKGKLNSILQQGFSTVIQYSTVNSIANSGFLWQTTWVIQ